MRLFASILTVACVLGLACPIYADTVNFDLYSASNFGGTPVNYTGTAAAPDTGTYWTPFRIEWGSSTYWPVKESDGVTASPIYMQIDGGGYTGYWNHDGTGIAANLMDSYAYSNNGTGWTVEIDHLTPGGKYDLYWYQQNGCSATSTGSFTFGGNTLTATNTGQNSAFIENNNYVHFWSVAADSNGSIFGTIGHTASICGVQIMSVPEPSACILLGMGLIGLLAYAWRKRK